MIFKGCNYFFCSVILEKGMLPLEPLSKHKYAEGHM